MCGPRGGPLVPSARTQGPGGARAGPRRGPGVVGSRPWAGRNAPGEVPATGPLPYVFGRCERSSPSGAAMELGRQIPFYQVDAFTERPFHGSPCAVFLPEEPVDPRAMQLMAREMN